MTLQRCHYFSPKTDPKLYACSCGECETKPTNRLLQRLDQVRHVADVPFIVTSGPRCRKFNREIGGAENSEHIDGNAADIACSSAWERMRIVEAALLEGVKRIGIGKDFVHLGVSEDHGQDLIWTYY